MVGHDAQQLEAFDFAFRDLYLRDILHADAGDVRMGTFVLCGAFIDALSLTYSAGLPAPGGLGAKWSRFMKKYFGPSYESIWDSYVAFRSKLLHNYSPRGLGFIHAPENAALHLQKRSGKVILHRETFVRDVAGAFEHFAADLRTDDDLRRRALAHFAEYPPMGLLPVNLPGDQLFPGPDLTPTAAVSASVASSHTFIRRTDHDVP